MQVPLTRIQKLITQRMLFSKQNKPSFYLQSKADMTDLLAERPKLRKSSGVKITTNAFYIRALGLAVRDFPLMAGRLCNESVRIEQQINVGFAVNAPQGLVVPVVRDADKKTLPEIALQEQLLTDKARDNRLTLEEIEGETVALSNLGIYGIDLFLGIVPPQATTILSVANLINTAVVVDGQIAVRKELALSIAVDSRLINESYAAQFLARIKQLLENPKQLI
jgi:pyruvate dehydrogenase E2 component (dihydrolipoamide acetyltransferase)